MKQFKAVTLAAALIAISWSGPALATNWTINPVMTAPGEWFADANVTNTSAFLNGDPDVFTILFPMGTIDLNLRSYDVSLGIFGEPTTKFDHVSFTSAAGTVPVPAVKVGPFSFAQYSVLDVAGPFSVLVDGSTTGGYTLRASFTEVSPVPELNTVALMLAGLLGIGFLSRRSLPR